MVFLEVYCEIRPLALNQHNIESAWRESGLLPYNPELILSKLKRSSKSSSRPSTASGLPPPLDITTTPTLIIPLQPGKTPHNVAEVQRFLREIFDGKISEAVGLEKLAKAA
jgi:hypothetical protein